MCLQKKKKIESCNKHYVRAKDCAVGGQRESLQSFIPLTCGGGRANAVDEVGRVAVTASEA